jgi:hypothetical protein
VSFGGSALFMTLLSTGILLNISQHGTSDATSRRRASRSRAADARSAARGALPRPTPSGA